MPLSRSLYLTAPCQTAWLDEHTGPPGPGEVLVRTLASVVSVGAELPVYGGTQRHLQPVAYPVMTGYEDVASVEGLYAGAEIHANLRVAMYRVLVSTMRSANVSSRAAATVRVGKGGRITLPATIRRRLTWTRAMSLRYRRQRARSM